MLGSNFEAKPKFFPLVDGEVSHAGNHRSLPAATTHGSSLKIAENLLGVLLVLLEVEVEDEIPSPGEVLAVGLGVDLAAHPLAAHELSRLAARFNHLLAAGAADGVEGAKGGRDVVGGADGGEEGSQNEGVLDGGAGAGDLLGRHGVRGVSHHALAAAGVGVCLAMLVHGLGPGRVLFEDGLASLICSSVCSPVIHPGCLTRQRARGGNGNKNGKWYCKVVL